jgi:hypothetical protein
MLICKKGPEGTNLHLFCIVLIMLSEETRQRLEKLHRIQILGIDLDILFTFIVSYYIANIIHSTVA